jgi:hypothetical protein
MVQDLQGKIAERSIGVLDPLAGIRFSKGNTEVFTEGFHFPGLLLLWYAHLSGLCKGVQVFNTLFEIAILNTRLETKLMLDSTGVGIDQLKSRSAESSAFSTFWPKKWLTAFRASPPFPNPLHAHQRGSKWSLQDSAQRESTETSISCLRCNARRQKKCGKKSRDRRRYREP